MPSTPQRPNADGHNNPRSDVTWRNAVRQEDLVWRQDVRKQDTDWRTAIRNEDLAWREQTREEDTRWRTTTYEEKLEWRRTQLHVESEEARRSNRRYALLAASQTVKSGSTVKDVLELAAQYAAWIETPGTATSEKSKREFLPKSLS